MRAVLGAIVLVFLIAFGLDVINFLAILVFEGIA
jgi:hypothetical protein